MTRLFIFIIAISSLIVNCTEGGGGGIKASDPPQREYTLEEPGRWQDLASTHIPKVEFFEGRDEKNILAYIILGDNDSHHVIEKIGIMDSEFNDVGNVKSFGGLKKQSYSAYLSLPNVFGGGGKGYKVFVKCNLHDLWTIKVEEALEKFKASKK